VTRTALRIAALATVYFLAGKLGLGIAFVHPSASAVWPPAGIALAALLWFGRGLWPGVMAGAFLVNVTTAGSFATSLAIAAGNTLEAVIAHALIERRAHGVRCFDRGRAVLRFVLLAGVLATAVSPSVGVMALALAGYAEWSRVAPMWLTWWVGDMGGILVVTPFLVLWARDHGLDWRPARLVEAAALLVATLVVALVVFGPPAFMRSPYPLSYVCLLPLLWATFRFGPREAATIVLAIAIVAVPSTLAGFGTFAVGSANAALGLLDVFLTVVSTTSLGLAAVVHERRTAANALRDAERLLRERARGAEAASRAKDQFLAVLGHELRSPLSALASASAALRVIRGADEKAGRLTDIIDRQTRYLARLVNDLLEVSRLDATKIALRREIMDLKALTERCIASLDMSRRLDAHAFSTSLYSCWVDGDPVRLEQVVTNVLENAVKYTPAGKGIHVALRPENGTAVLEVIDEGHGIDAKTLPHVFDFFAQADDALDRSHGGLGIGLTIVRRLVELHGGSVAVASEGRGCGSRFTVRLPLAEPARRVPATEAAAIAPNARPLRVLLVEDYADAREALRQLLESLGHSVESAADGPSGVAAALASVPDVALVDIGLPGLDGFGVAAEIRARLGDHRVRLVALTGYGQDQVRRRALESGFDACLMKPVVDVARLVAALSTPTG
jgi:signal transduction histidine kinase/CheY-like chemotaxis protein